MYMDDMDDMETFVKKKKKLKTLIQAMSKYSQYIGMKFDIEKCHANDEKRKTTNYGRNRTIKSRKNQNARRKVLGAQFIRPCTTSKKNA